MSGEFRMSCGVYALVDPRTGRTMYVGMSTDIERRYRSHVAGITRDRNRPKADWIVGLLAEGMEPELVVLTECRMSELEEEERRWIRTYRQRGEAEFNRSDGGYGGCVTKGNTTARDEWFQLGIKLKKLTAMLSEIIQDLGDLAPKRFQNGFVLLQRGLTVQKAMLEGYLRKLYPDWETVTRDIFSA